MNEEILREEGLVTEIKNGQMKIELINTSGCESCTTKDICKSGKVNHIFVRYDGNYEIGNHIVIEILGREVLKTVILLYGIPTVLLLISLFTAYFSLGKQNVFYSILVSFISIGIYYLLLKNYLKDFSSLYKIKIYKKEDNIK